MSDAWYYAEGDAACGPMTLAELAALLASVSQTSAVLVWRQGLENWQRAGNVPEIAAALSKQPAPRAEAARAPAPRPAAAPAPAADADASIKDIKPVSDPGLSGIGGWLILMAIGQVLGPLRFFVSMAEYYSSLDRSLIERFPAAVIGEAIFNAALAVLFVTTAVLFFRTSRRFPRFFVYEILASVFSVPLAASWAAVTIGMATGQPVGTIFVGTLEPREVGQAIATAIVGSIWILYLYKSKRVANTFVN